MIIGSCVVELFLYEPSSLKEKRQIIKSLIGRIQSRFNVSIAEVGMQDKWRSAEIGFACVSTTKKHANQMLDAVIRFMNHDSRVEMIRWDVEIL